MSESAAATVRRSTRILVRSVAAPPAAAAPAAVAAPAAPAAVAAPAAPAAASARFGRKKAAPPAAPKRAAATKGAKQSATAAKLDRASTAEAEVPPVAEDAPQVEAGSPPLPAAPVLIPLGSAAEGHSGVPTFEGRHFHIFGLSFTQHSLITSVFNLAESISGRSTQQIFADMFRSMLRITPDATRQIRIFEATHAGAFVREIALDGTVRAAPPAPKHTPRCPTCNIEISSTPVRSRALSAIAAILRDADDAGLIYEVVEPDETDRPGETVPSPRSPSPLPPAVGPPRGTKRRASDAGVDDDRGEGGSGAPPKKKQHVV